ncbi:MAG: ankyrin repeat domain-containing protein, partial [Verrucomicrobiota bacterium]|jgi:ankyrin repeat protein|nr:ankyrin repeat domain-containing protein [Verrucomicrobiota bacterium]
VSSLSNNIDNLRFKAEKFRDKNAQFELGRKYLQGDGVDQDLDEARKWLIMAQENGHPQAVQLLDGMRGSVDDSKSDFFNEIERLIETGADLNAPEDAWLIRAIYDNELEALELLLKAGVDPNQKYGEDWPLRCASYSSKEIIIALLEGGADVNLQDDPEHPILVDFVDKGETEIVQALLKAGADPNCAPSDYPSFTPLKRVIRQLESKPEIVKLLLEAGADSNQGDEYNTLLQEAVSVAVHVAEEAGQDAVAQIQVVELLLGAGADPDGTVAGGDDRVPLEGALLYQNQELLRLLLEAGADPNRFDVVGDTPLSRAIMDNSTEIVKLLLEAGADPNLRNPERHHATPIEMAYKNPEIIRLLIEAGVDSVEASELLEKAIENESSLVAQAHEDVDYEGPSLDKIAIAGDEDVQEKKNEEHLICHEGASLSLQRHRIASLIAQRFEVTAATSFKQQARNDVSNQKPVNSSKSGCSTVFLFAGIILMICGYLLS